MKIHITGSIAFILCMICFSSSFSQLPSFIEWQKTIGGLATDELHKMIPTADGGYLLGGMSDSPLSFDKTDPSNGFTDYWVIKLDALGNIQWQNSIGGSSSDVLFTMSQTADGGFILGGASDSPVSGDKTDTVRGDYDYWIVKTDDQGIVQWDKTIGGDMGDLLYSIEQTADGGYILCGGSESYALGDKTEDPVGGRDIWIVKTDATGNIQWQNTVGGTDMEFDGTIHQTPDGGYIVGCSSGSDISGDKSEDSWGFLNDFWIFKLDASGNILWDNTIGGTDTEYLYDVCITSDGGFILAGLSESDISGDKTENGLGGSDYWIVKTDSLGNIQWQNTIGGNYFEELRSVRQTSDGGYVLGGYSHSMISGDKTEDNYDPSGQSPDFWVVKTDGSGNIQWQKTLGASMHDMLYCVEQTSDGAFILGGSSISNAEYDKEEDSRMNTWDYWVVKWMVDYNLITGKVFMDGNLNQVYDVGEVEVLNKAIIEQGTGKMVFSDAGGNYEMAITNAGSYTVNPLFTTYFNALPAQHVANFPGLNFIDSLNDFALQPAGVFPDLCISITPATPFRANFAAAYQVEYQNVGTTILSPTVIFYPDPELTFSNAVPFPSSVTPDSLVWMPGPMLPGQVASIMVYVNVSANVSMGDTVISGAVIEPLAGDVSPGCNTSYIEVIIIGSFDPNDITVDEDSLASSLFPNPPYLDYLIRFQNTGNDTAFNVKIVNLIDPLMLDVLTLNLVSSSDPVQLFYHENIQSMEFKFSNILLPDSTTNEMESHGYIRYRIKPLSSLTAGDQIANSADIYFDFNAAVHTNDAITQVLLLSGMGEPQMSSAGISIFPNPASDILTVRWDKIKPGKVTICLTDVTGKMIYNATDDSENNHHSLDISHFTHGMYLMEVQCGDDLERMKVTIE